MINYKKGDILQSDAEALVNTVNTVGVMGKGIALQFKEAFPHNNKVYVKACKEKGLQPGKVLSVWDESLLHGRKLIINFPTKVHWRQPSQYDYIERGLPALREVLRSEKVKSVAIPPLGCGHGGLEWNKVRAMIVEALEDLDLDIQVYEPNTAIKKVLQKQAVKKEVKLTPARASLLYALFAFESMGEYSSLFAANKLAYFLQRKGQKLQLQFRPYHYGPYAVGVEKVLYHLNGVYLNGLEQGQAQPFEALLLNYEKWEEVNKYVHNEMPKQDALRLKDLLKFISGYTSELSLEILATVDFILDKRPDYTVEEVMEAISGWNMRKQGLFKKEHVEKAYHHLKKHGQEVFESVG